MPNFGCAGGEPDAGGVQQRELQQVHPAPGRNHAQVAAHEAFALRVYTPIQVEVYGGGHTTLLL